MRLLRPDLLHEVAKNPLHTLEVIDLRRYGVIKLGGFEECPNLHTILLSENSIVSLEGIEDASAVWNLDLSKNAIVNVESLGKIPALGWLNLSNNNLTYEQVSKLINTSVIDLTLENNDPLSDGYSPSEYRRNLVYLLPKAWCIDHCFITSEERKKAIDYFEEGDGKGSDIAEIASKSFNNGNSCVQLGSGMFHLGSVSSKTTFNNNNNNNSDDVDNNPKSPGKNVTLNGDNSNNENDMSNSTLKVSATSKFLKLLAIEPHHPTIVQTFRLKHLKRLHNVESKRLRHYFSRAVPRPGVQTLKFGNIASYMFKNLMKRQLLDLTVMLTVSIFYKIPNDIFLDSLTMLLKADVDMNIIESVASLYRYGKTILSIETKNILKSYIDKKNPMYILNFIEKELYNAIPEFAATLNTQRHASIEDDEDERIGQEHLARHAVILFSRSPAFPPLVRGRDKKIPAHERHLYEVLFPLLKLAGMTNEDLETHVDENQWIRRKDNPSRRYSRPWEGGDVVVSSDAGPLENVPRDDGDEMVENEIAGNEGDYHNNNNVNYESEEDDLSYLPRNFGVGGVSPRSQQYSQPLTRGTDAFANAFDDDTNYNAQPSTAMYYQGIRVPRIHERVEIATRLLGRIYPRIIEVLDSGSIIKLEPFPGATRDTQWLMHRDIFWNPKGYWRHGSGVAHVEAENSSRRLGKATRLHRVNKGLTKSGISSNAGVANRALPAGLARMFLENKTVPDHVPKPLKLFANNQTWDPNFVVAPPSLVTAQNMYAEAIGEGGAWDPIKTIPYIVKDSTDAANKGYVDKATDLRPQRSSVFENLEKQLRRDEDLKMETLTVLIEEDELVLNNGVPVEEKKQTEEEETKNDGASFFMTGVPQQNEEEEKEKEQLPVSRPLTSEIEEDLMEQQRKNRLIARSASPPRSAPQQEGSRSNISQTTASNHSNNADRNNRKKKSKPKGTHSWYAVPNKTSIMVEQRVVPSSAHGPFFRPKTDPSKSSSVKFLTEREKEMVRIEKRLSDKRWATTKFADRSLSNRVRPYETYHEQPPIKFQPVENTMPKPLLPQPGLSAGLRAKMSHRKKNIYKQFDNPRHIFTPNTQGSMASLLFKKNNKKMMFSRGTNNTVSRGSSMGLGSAQSDEFFFNNTMPRRRQVMSTPTLSELAPAPQTDKKIVKKSKSMKKRKNKKMSRLARRQMERKSQSTSEL